MEKSFFSVSDPVFLIFPVEDNTLLKVKEQYHVYKQFAPKLQPWIRRQEVTSKIKSKKVTTNI